ncbi:MAG: stage III sporulation protein AF [Christensenellales bacterium]
MKQWILAIVGIVALGVLVDVILPEGQSAKYIKGIFGVVVVITIISPVVNLLNNVSHSKLYFDSSGIEIEEGTYSNLIGNLQEIKEQEIADKLVAQGYSPSEIKIKFCEGNDYKVESICIYIRCNENEKQNITQILSVDYKGVKINFYDC